MSLRASKVRTAWVAGITREPGRRAWRTTAVKSMWCIRGTKKNRPPKSVWNAWGGQVEQADISDGGRFGADGLRSFVIEPAWQACEAFLAEQQGQGGDADVVSRGCQLTLDVVDREILFAQGDDPFADAIAGRCGAWTAWRGRGEGLTLGGVVSELMTQDTEGDWGIAEGPCDFGGRKLADEVVPEGFVLALQRGASGPEELGCLEVR